MSDSREREDLEALLSAPGWLRYKEYVKRMLGPEGYGRIVFDTLESALDGGKDDKTTIIEALAAHKATKLANSALSWPEERVNSLRMHETARTQAAQPSLSRRGVL